MTDRLYRALVARISDDLRAMTDDALAALFASRPDLHADPPADVNALAQRLSTPTGARIGLEQLDRPALQVCHHVVLVAGHPLYDGAVRASDLAEWLALAPGEPAGEELLDAVGAALDRLRGVGLVHGDPARPVSGLRQVLAPPLAAGRTARRLLDLAPDSAVRLLAEQHGLDPGDLRRARERLGDLLPELGPATLLEGVSEAAVGLFVEAVEHLEYAVPLPGVPVEQGGSARAKVDPALEFVLRGVLLPLTPAVGEIPRELRHAVLREVEPYLVRLRPPEAPPRPPVAVREAAAADAAERAGRVVGLVERLLETWSREPAVQLTSGGLGVKELRRAAKLLEVDERDAGRIVELALVAGLLRGERRGPAVLPSPAYDEWLALDVPHRWAVLAGAWWRSERLPSAAGSREGGQPLPALHWQSPSEALDVRHRVLAILAEQPGLPEDAVLDRLHAVAPVRWASPAAELVPRGAYAEAVLLGVVAGPPTPGVVAPWGPDGSGSWPGEDAVRQLTAALPERVPVVTLQADLTAIAAGPVSPETGRVLDLLADVESRGAATVWRFGPASVRRAFDDGWTAARVLSELEQIAARGVPGTLATLVGDVARRHGQVRVGAALAYLRCADESVLAELTRAKRLAPLKLRVVAPLVAVSPAKPAKVVELLRAAGYSPAADEGGGVTVGRAEPRRGEAELVAAIGLGLTARLRPVLEPAIWVRRLRVADEPEVRRRRQALERLAAAARGGQPVRLTYVAAGGQQRQHRVVPLAVHAERVQVQRLTHDGPGEWLDLAAVDVLDVGEVG